MDPPFDSLKWRDPFDSRVFLLGHLGIGLGLAWLLAWRAPRRADFRLVLFGAVLPDLIDKPLGIALGLDTRIVAHTFVFLFAILAMSLLPGGRLLRFVGFGGATHLLLDEIWSQPGIALWPAFGWAFPPVPFDAGRWFDTLLTDSYVQAGEIIGTAILILFALRHGLFSWSAIRAFLAHGALPNVAGSQP